MCWRLFCLRLFHRLLWLSRRAEHKRPYARNSGLLDLDMGDRYVRQLTTEGMYTCYDGENPASRATVIVEMARVYIQIAMR